MTWTRETLRRALQHEIQHDVYPNRNRREQPVSDTLGMNGATTTSGYVLDACHDQLKPGDVVIADYRGQPACRFEVLSDTGTGLLMFRDPDGKERPMRPSTMLALAIRVERPSELVKRAVDYIRERDCDFLTAETVAMYAHVSEEQARRVMIDELGMSPKLVA